MKLNCSKNSWPGGRSANSSIMVSATLAADLQEGRRQVRPCPGPPGHRAARPIPPAKGLADRRAEQQVLGDRGVGVVAARRRTARPGASCGSRRRARGFSRACSAAQRPSRAAPSDRWCRAGPYGRCPRPCRRPASASSSRSPARPPACAGRLVVDPVGVDVEIGVAGRPRIGQPLVARRASSGRSRRASGGASGRSRALAGAACRPNSSCWPDIGDPAPGHRLGQLLVVGRRSGCFWPPRRHQQPAQQHHQRVAAAAAAGPTMANVAVPSAPDGNAVEDRAGRRRHPAG